jgi:hypothetical protein
MQPAPALRRELQELLLQVAGRIALIEHLNPLGPRRESMAGLVNVLLRHFRELQTIVVADVDTLTALREVCAEVVADSEEWLEHVIKFLVPTEMDRPTPSTSTTSGNA